MNTSDYLEHHGIKGMKWGVRRYQNYGGTYTQAGLKRYRDAEAKYDKADTRYKRAKATLKTARRNDDYQGTVSAKAEVTQAKLSRKMAKANLEKHYDHLKQDKLGDQGKLLYASGKTITGDKSITNTLATVGSVAVSAAIYGHSTGLIHDKRITAALAAVGGVSYAAAVGKGVKDEYEAKRLRAYYSHTSKY